MTATEGPLAPVLGIDLGGTNMNLAVVDASDRILARGHERTDAPRGVEDVLDRLAARARSVVAEAGLEMGDVGGIGVAVASPVDVEHGIALHAMNLGWRDIAMRDDLQRRLDRSVVIDNDVNGAVWGEYRLGAGRGASQLLGVWVGTGVGGGLVLGGRLHHGAQHTAGEIGQTVLDPSGPLGARTVEELTSRTGMSRIVRELLPEYPDSALHDAPDARGIVAAPRLGEAWQAGDELAGRVVHEAARLLGIAVANCVTLLSLDAVVIGGGVTEALGDPYLDLIRASFREAVFPDRCRETRIVMTQLEADAGLLGAAMLARESLPAR